MLFLRPRPELLAGRRVLHFAPDYALERHLRAVPGIDYLSADLDPAAAELTADITALPLPDASFDVVVCSHVLEHVDDDIAAMREIARVMRSAGLAIVLVPVDHARAETYEDPAVVAPADRQREFWQPDHVRLYGRDFAERLRSTGLEVEVMRMAHELGAEAAERYGLLPDEEIFLCRAVARGPESTASLAPAMRARSLP